MTVMEHEFDVSGGFGVLLMRMVSVFDEFGDLVTY